MRNNTGPGQIWRHIPTDGPGLGLQAGVDVALQAQARDQLTLPAVLTFSKAGCCLMVAGQTTILKTQRLAAQPQP